MRSFGWFNSVVTRLAMGFCLGGLVLTVCLGVLEYRQSARTAGLSTVPSMVMMSHHLRDVLRPLIVAGKTDSIPSALGIFAHDPRIIATRYRSSVGLSVTEGDWPNPADAHLWTLDTSTHDGLEHLDLTRPTVLVVPFTEAGRDHRVSLAIDGPYILSEVRAGMIRELATQWLVLGILTLAGLIALRHWFSVPLTRIATLARGDASAETFAQAAAEIGGELGDLAHAVGRMLRRINEMTGQLRQREQAFANLFEFAPAAIISIGPDGRITEANRRAADLFGVERAEQLHGTAVLNHIAERDRAPFRQRIDRLNIDAVTDCELQMVVGERTPHIAMELASVHDEQGNLTQVRISLVDVTESRWLMAKVAEHRRLLDLVINHMSDAILLIDTDRRILTANERLSRLLNLRTDGLEGETYDPAEFWTRLEPVDPAQMDRRLGQLLDQFDRAGETQLDTRDASFQFQVIPVRDEMEQPIAQLWVVQEITAQVRSRRLLDQQASQLRALKQIGARLHDLDGVSHLLEQAVAELHEIMNVEATGIALRDVDPNTRCSQLIHPGADRTLRPAGSAMAQAVAEKLMPEVLKSRGTSLWPDLASDARWASAFGEAGIESIAATALTTQRRVQGIVWIGRKGGQRITTHHLYLLEALAPILSTSVENAQLREHITSLRLTDTVTELPSYEQFELLTNRLVNRPGEPWSLILVDIDHFRAINDRLGHHGADRVLRRVGRTIADSARSTDQVCRYSEDQFVVLSPGAEPAEAAELADRIRTRIADLTVDPETDRAEPIRLTCSIGLAASPTDHCDADMLIYLAMQRLNTAKANGRNRVVATGHPTAAAG